jgi:hypothetical protein
MSPRNPLTSLSITSVLLLISMAPALGASPSPSLGPSPSASVLPSAQPSLIADSFLSPSPNTTPCPSASPILSLSPGLSASPTFLTSASPSGSGLPPSSSPLLTPSPSPSPEPCTPADPKVGLGVGPSQVILSAEQRTGAFSVYNAGDLDEVVALTATDYLFDADGQRSTSDTNVPQGAAAWLTIDPATFTLTPESSQTVTFSVDIPDDATPGDHVAAIKIIGGFTDQDWTRYANDHRKNDPISFKSRVSFSVDVVARVPGVILPSLLVPGFEVFLPSLITTSNGQFTFTPKIVNDGNVAAVWSPHAGSGQTLEAIVPTLSLTSTGGLFAQNQVLFDGARNDDGSVKLSTLTVMPGASYTQRLTLQDAPVFGTYKYAYKLPGSTVDGRADIIKTGSFTIVNLQKVFYWIVLPLMVLMVLFALMLIGRRRRTLHRRTAEALREREVQKARLEGYEQAWRDQVAAHERRGR